MQRRSLSTTGVPQLLLYLALSLNRPSFGMGGELPAQAGLLILHSITLLLCVRPPWYFQNKIFKSENDTHEFVAYFQKEMETKDGMISKLHDEFIRKEVRVAGSTALRCAD